MPTIDLPQGQVSYRAAGPADSTAAPVVFVHGLLVNGELWTGVADALAAQGIRSYAPDLPLGAHQIPLADTADVSPRGVAQLILDFLAALDLQDVTLVGNDTGGALCQFVIDTDATRIGRLLLTNCDAFEQFPPPPFGALVALGRSPARLRFAMRAMRPKPLRHSLLGYGGLATSLDPAMTARWAGAALADKGVARDGARFMAAVDKRELIEVGGRLGGFGRPVLLVWGMADRFFKPALAHRLRDAFGAARLVEVAGARAFVPLDRPEQLAQEISAFTRTAV